MRRRVCLISLIVVLSLMVVNAWGTPFAYITNYESSTVSVIDTATNTVIGSPIPVGSAPYGVAVNPSGTRVYVANVGNGVSVIDTAANTVIGSPIAVGQYPHGIAVNPSGTRVYVANYGGGTVSVIDTATNMVTDSPIPVGGGPWAVAVNPAGTRLYVTSYDGNNVSVIDATTNTVIGSPIPVGTRPEAVEVNSSGTRVYVANSGSNNVFVIDTATNTMIGSPIAVGTEPMGVAVNPSGTRIYVANSGSNNVSVIDTATNTVIGSPIPVGTYPIALGQFIGPSGSLDEGTIGTEFTITGSGFGTTKGQVLVGNVALKILEWTDSLISCQLTRAMPLGTYNVTIKPRTRGASPIIIENGFTLEAPEIGTVNPTSGSIGDEITINGFFYGTTKGKVTLGGKTCRILSWDMDSTTGESEIHFVVPRGLSPGAQELKVSNGEGADTINFTVK